MAQVLSGRVVQKSPKLKPMLQQAFCNLSTAVQMYGMSWVAPDWAQWITRWQNKVADKAANKAMDLGTSYHWVAHEPLRPQECLLAYADGGCRARGHLAIGQGAAACVLVAHVPGSRRGRLIHTTAVYWEAVSAPVAETVAAGMATLAIVTIASQGLQVQTGYPVSSEGLTDADLRGFLEQMEEEYFREGVSIAGSFVSVL